MKVLHTADWHIGQFKGPVEDGVNLRSLDTVKCLEYMVEKAREEKPDLVCISGDVFHQEQIGPARYSDEMVTATRIIDELSKVGAMTRAKMCTDEKSPAVFDISENEITVSIRDNIANYQEKVALQEKIKDPIKIGFDSRLVLETIKAFTCDNITLNLTRPVNPMVVEAEDSDMKALVLPVRLKDA